MLDQSDETPTFCCTQCSHVALWPFQLDHHIQRNHRNIYTAELSETLLEPEQYPCNSCNFKSCYKLNRYEHSASKCESGTVKIIESHPFIEEFKSYFCKDCKYKGHSVLSMVKHKDSCELILKVQLEHISLPASSWIKSKNRKLRSNSFRCAQCLFNGKTKSSLKRHMVEHAAAKGASKCYNCTECPYLSKRKSDLKRHTLKKHASTAALPLLIHLWLNCAKCPYRAKDKKTLQRHMLTHAGEVDWFVCNKCPYLTKRRENLKRHTLTHAAPDEIAWLQCTECAYRAKQKMYLQRHMLTHFQAGAAVAAAPAAEQAGWFRCTECSFRTKQKGNLKVHVTLRHAAHDDIEWFNCTACPYKAKQRGTLKKHMQTHTTGKDADWFSCALCPYRTKDKTDMETHVSLKHPTAEDVSQRPEGSRQTEEEPLGEHFLTRTATPAATDDGKRFSCIVCSYRSKHNSNMQRHMLSHGDWMNCTECSYRTRYKYHLEKHMSAHVTEPVAQESNKNQVEETGQPEGTGTGQETNLSQAAELAVIALMQDSINEMLSMIK